MDNLHECFCLWGDHPMLAETKMALLLPGRIEGDLSYTQLAGGWNQAFSFGENTVLGGFHLAQSPALSVGGSAGTGGSLAQTPIPSASARNLCGFVQILAFLSKNWRKG